MAGSLDKENKNPETSYNSDDKTQSLESTKESAIQENDEKVQKKYKEIQENNDIIQEKIKEKDKIIQEKDKTIQGKDDLIQVKDNLIQQKDNFIKVKDNLIQEQKEIIEKLKEQNKEFQNIQERDSIIQERDGIIQERDSKIQEKDNAIQEKDKKIQELVKKIQEKDKTIQKVIEEKDKKIQEKDKEIQDLKQDNSKFKKEASEYQYALGAATNYRLSDDNKNDSVKLKEDIMDLRRSLENYITKCKGNVEISIPKVQNLLKSYGSQTDITKEQKKPLIRVAIQRHVIEQILEYAEEYFDDRTISKFKGGMESFMSRKANELIEVAEVFARERVGTDNVTKVFPIKLRQQIFAALGNRGFNNVVLNDQDKNFIHYFIKKYQPILNKEVDKYRKINDPDKKQEIEDMAGNIIRKVVTLFCFRLKVEEPTAQYIWFNYKDKIDPSRMEGIWDEEDIDKIVVDICHFPLIASKSDTNQIYTPAKVFPIYNEEIKETGSFEK
ncbi:hypothetical protein RclHR1_07890007 [Rhizophagus clarus]|uniref:Uncharacterized protein n=1 Tax=Rhizophagus clarus TaxID=94130 RepID=A0A2Z6SDF8_9GLOM|nr:hypothetical protein RclHR1_07890007 [Rhizophagus clarus]GES97234.1 hypothetical protein GLOIN_2v1678875 [Rhizophagus clarus]